MELLGLSLPLVFLFVSFGFVVGVLFGFFGMGGAFLITPTLLMFGYPAPVAIGSGLAFYFGTSVIAVMQHYHVGQVNYKLGAIMFLGLSIGIEFGRMLVFRLENLGIAGIVTGTSYVILLAGVGLLFLHRAQRMEGSVNESPNDPDDIPAIARRVQDLELPPMIALISGGRASIWTISGVGGIVGLVSGMLGVGGGFIRMPAIYYLIGTPLSVAVGTSLFAGLFSGAYGTFTYGLAGSVDLVAVGTLLIGSVLGARIGSAATTLVAEESVIIYFGLMMLIVSLAIAISEFAHWLDIEVLGVVSVVILMGATFTVSGLVLYMAISAMTPEIQWN